MNSTFAATFSLTELMLTTILYPAGGPPHFTNVALNACYTNVIYLS